MGKLGYKALLEGIKQVCATVPHDCFYDPDRRYDIRRGELPHLQATRGMQFVTLHLADSLPREAVEAYIQRRDEFHRINPQPWRKEVSKRYSEEIERPLNHWIHQGHGSCLLRRPEVREKVFAQWVVVARNFEVDMHAMVVMPNHIHLLGVMDEDFEKVISEFKRQSTWVLQTEMASAGISRLWMRECFDHLIRSREQLEMKTRYIADNPRGFPPQDYTLWIRDLGFLIR